MNRQLKTQNTKHKTSFAQALRLRSGQAMLVAILMVTAAILAMSVAVISLGSAQVKIASGKKQSTQAYSLAEACLENALEKMARGNYNPVVIDFPIGVGECTINVIGVSPYTIESFAEVGKTRRTIRATVTVNNEVLTIGSWEETY